MPPNPPRNAQRLRRARDMSSTCAWRPLLVLHNFPVFSLLLSIMPGNNKIKFLYRNARSFDPQTKGMLASALVQCHFDYACSMWFSCVSSTSRKRLQIIQNKLIIFILGISTRSHIGYREFSSSNMLPV